MLRFDRMPDSMTQLPDLSRPWPLLPLRSAVLFPGVVVPFDIGRTKTIALAQSLGEAVAAKKDAYIVAFTQKRAETDDPAADELMPIGTLGRVVGALRQNDGNYAMVVQGVETVPFHRATVELVKDDEVSDAELDALGMSLREAVGELLKRGPQIPRELAAQLSNGVSTAAVADFVAAHVEISVEDRYALLAEVDPKKRAREVLRHVTRHIEALKMREKINATVKDELGKTQREHVLRQQMKAIKDELNDGEDDSEEETDELENRISEAKLPEEANEVAKKQLKRLRGMSPQSPEHGMTRTYLDWILDLPWEKVTEDNPDLTAVRATLEADHYGLEKVKRRILEFLAVRKLKAATAAKNEDGRSTALGKGPILCLVGPPGVGKTSLAKSIAHATSRKLHRISLGGVHDEAAIRGHRRTYIGALPGQIIQGMKKVGTTNPVFVLDEIDKLGRDFRGDPSSALLEVLDPEQNNTFADHYLEIPYDLSNVMFIATANTADTIPPPLRDRMEIIEIPSYTRLEKLAIARRHLVTKQLGEHGLTDQVEITDDALTIVIEQYTREAGVRGLERKIAQIVRGVAVEVVETSEGGTKKAVIATEAEVRKYLGPAKFVDEVAERTEDPGVVTGLAWTPVGGTILFIESSRMPGAGKLILTGQLGDVMKESVQAAMSYVRANADRFGIETEAIEKSDVHVHVPAGAMPKDGPSAGVTMLTSLVSLFTGIRARHDVAMTGEITLRGRVLPIGGLKEKVLAAHRAGIKRIILPERNRADLEDVPAEVKAELEFVPVGTMDEVIAAALERAPEALPKKKAAAPAGAGSATPAA
jgi:ATP-dependent Lon protease